MAQSSSESEIRCLGKVAKILSKNILAFKNESKIIFSSAINHDKKSMLPALVTFSRRLTSEARNLTECHNVGLKITYAQLPIFSYVVW